MPRTGRIVRDPELVAMETVLRALKGLEPDVQDRILGHVQQILGRERGQRPLELGAAAR